MPDTSNTAGVPTWTDAYLAGLQAGYWARIGEENERWARSVVKLHVVEQDQFVRIAGKLERVWTWREREARRLEVLAEGHAAGLHSERAAYGCPGCSS